MVKVKVWGEGEDESEVKGVWFRVRVMMVRCTLTARRWCCR